MREVNIILVAAKGGRTEVKLVREKRKVVGACERARAVAASGSRQTNMDAALRALPSQLQGSNRA